MEKTFFSYAFGCRVNEAEKEEIDQQMLQAGFSFKIPNQVAIHIVNTCAITAKAGREARQYIYQIKKRYPKTKIIVTGCSATYWKNQNIDKTLPIDLLIDNTNKKFLVDIILKRFFEPTTVKQTAKVDRVATSKFLKSGRAMIKIQDGCQRFCSYCIVPYLRGLPKSLLIKDILTKINSLKNIKEIVLTAINTEAFGYDTGENLIELIDRVMYKTSIPRISFGSIHPWSIDQKFLNYYKKIINEKRFVNFFHIPLQSGCDKILKLMKRDYTIKEFTWKIQEIKKINSNALIATDVIAGFLDESDKNFETTYRFLESNPIDRFHVFRFSNQVKTASFYMKERLSEAPEAIKIKRAKALTALSQEKYQKFLQTLIDNKYQSQALFLDKFQDGYQQALLDNQVLVWVKTNKKITGQIKKVYTTTLNKNILYGQIDKK